MRSKNMSSVLAALRSLGVSDNFARGALFLFAAVNMRIGEGITPEGSAKAQQWLFAYDINKAAEDILGRMYGDGVERALEEFLYKVGIKTVFSDIREAVLNLCTPANHNLLANVPELEGDSFPGELAVLSKLYFGLAEEIGRDLERSGFTYEEAYLAGICFLNSWCYVDYVAVSLIITLLYNLAPPVFKFFYVLPHNQTGAGLWLPTAMAMHGLLQGLSDEQFQGLAWAHQSWMLFGEGGVPYRGIEDLEAHGFFDHCCSKSKLFYDKYPHHLATVSEPSVDLEDFPTWTGTAAERDASFELIRSRWGYHPSEQSLTTIEGKQMRACIIFSLFCSMCKAARLQ